MFDDEVYYSMDEHIAHHVKGCKTCKEHVPRLQGLSAIKDTEIEWITQELELVLTVEQQASYLLLQMPLNGSAVRVKELISSHVQPSRAVSTRLSSGTTTSTPRSTALSTTKVLSWASSRLITARISRRFCRLPVLEK